MSRFQEMETFVCVVNVGNFSKAADQLCVARSAISSRISSLEERLGVQLLTRTTRKIRLTDDGYQFYRSSQNVLDLLNKAEQETINRHGNICGSIKIAAPQTFGINFLSPMLNEFVIQHPEISMDLHLDDKTLDIIEGKIDLAIRIGKLADSTLMSRRLSLSPRVLCASPAYLDKFGTPETPEELSQHTGIHYTYASKAAYWKFQNKDGEWLSVNVPYRFRANNGDALLQAAIAGIGVLISPRFICGDAINNNLLVEVMKDYKLEDDIVYALYSQQTHLPMRIRVLIDFLVQKFEFFEC